MPTLPNNSLIEISELAESLAVRLPQFKRFRYDGFSCRWDENCAEIAYDFQLGENEVFKPSATFRFPECHLNTDTEAAKKLVFQMGMVELLSYWKCACPQTIEVSCGHLNPSSVLWWQELMREGFGEFFWMNKMNIAHEATACAEILANKSIHFSNTLSNDDTDTVLVPIGGGKDSLLTLSLLLDAGVKVIPFAVNPGHSTRRTLEHFGLEKSSVIVERRLDKRLLELNREGFFNGHTPFSALLAFYSTFAAWAMGCRNIALSNESSADETSIGTVNHQFTKSTAFEQNFRSYVTRELNDVVEYFSFLRPLNELQIARSVSAVAREEMNLGLAVSCNRQITTGTWCGECPKCLSSSLLLLPFLGEEWLIQQFPKNPLDSSDLWELFAGLIGLTPQKPFECVPSRLDMRCALALIKNSTTVHWQSYALLRLWAEKGFPACATDFEVKNHLAAWNADHVINY